MGRMVNKEQTPSLQSKPNEGFQLHRPELLIATAHGNTDEIKRLLLHRKEDAVEVVLDVEETDIEDTVADIEHIVPVDVKKPAATAIPPSEAVTGAGDTVLHVVASSGDATEFLECAMVIVDKANHLLDVPNWKGDTPLHCAARSGNARMVSHLLDMARAGEGISDDERVKAILRMQNDNKETVLHEAVRLEDKDMIHKLLSEDSQLARVPLTDGPSPLYLALSLAHWDIAKLLFEKDKELSYSGPDGQNAFHAAAIRWKWGKEATKMLLERNKDLIKQADRSTGSTPLHFAAKRGAPMGLLLEAYPAAAYLPDSNGSFPIHLAKSNGHFHNVLDLLQQKKKSDSDSSKKEKSGHGPGDSSKEENKKSGSGPYCAQLRDGKGRTFLHVVVQDKWWWLINPACIALRKMLASSVMNMQDDDGNTALHLAVEAGDVRIVHTLVSIPEVNLNLTNKKGETPRVLASIRYREVETNRDYSNPWFRIYSLLDNVAVWTGSPRENILPRYIHNKEKGISQNIMDRTQIIGLGSVLVSTVTFAAAFAVPGGYRTDGTPTLAGQYAFNAFIMANTLAFIFSTGSTVLLMVAGLKAELVIEIQIISLLLLSEIFLALSVTSLGAAFAFGMYAVLAPLERNKAIICCSFTVSALLAMESVWGVNAVMMACRDEMLLGRRFGPRWWWRMAGSLLMRLMIELSPYIIIALSGLK